MGLYIIRFGSIRINSGINLVVAKTRFNFFPFRDPGALFEVIISKRISDNCLAILSATSSSSSLLPGKSLLFSLLGDVC